MPSPDRHGERRVRRLAGEQLQLALQLLNLLGLNGVDLLLDREDVADGSMAFARMARYCWRPGSKTVIRACRSTYWPGHFGHPGREVRRLAECLGALEDRGEAVGSPAPGEARCPSHGSTRLRLRVGGRRSRRRHQPAAVSCVARPVQLPRPTVSVREPVCSILADWPTAPARQFWRVLGRGRAGRCRPRTVCVAPVPAAPASPCVRGARARAAARLAPRARWRLAHLRSSSCCGAWTGALARPEGVPAGSRARP